MISGGVSPRKMEETSRKGVVDSGLMMELNGIDGLMSVGSWFAPGSRWFLVDRIYPHFDEFLDSQITWMARSLGCFSKSGYPQTIAFPMEHNKS